VRDLPTLSPLQGNRIPQVPSHASCIGDCPDSELVPAIEASRPSCGNFINFKHGKMGESKPVCVAAHGIFYWDVGPTIDHGIWIIWVLYGIVQKWWVYLKIIQNRHSNREKWHTLSQVIALFLEPWDITAAGEITQFPGSD